MFNKRSKKTDDSKLINFLEDIEKGYDDGRLWMW